MSERTGYIILTVACAGFAAFLLWGIITSSIEEGANRKVVRESGIMGLYRYEDPEYNVVCWTYKAGHAGGLQCIENPERRSNAR